MKLSTHTRAALLAACTAWACQAATAGVITSASDPALVGSTNIDFDNVASGYVSWSTGLNIGDVQFSMCFTCSPLWVGSYSAAGWSNPGNSLQTHWSLGPESIYARLTNGQTMSAFGFDMFSAESGFNMDVIDDLGGVTHVVIPAQAWPYTGYYGYAMTDAARSIREVQVYNRTWTWLLMDNFRYNTWTAPVTPPGDPTPGPTTPNGVPSPGTAPLLLAAIGGWLVARRPQAWRIGRPFSARRPAAA